MLVAAATGALLAVSALIAIRTYRYRSFTDTARQEVELSLLLSPARFSAEGLDALLAQYRDRGGFETVVSAPGHSVSSTPQLGVQAVPVDLVPATGRSTIRQSKATVTGRRYLVFAGTPARGVRVFFFFPLRDLDRSLDDFSAVLAVGWLVAVLCAAAFGHLVARRTLRPVRAAALASQSLAEGLLDTRLELTTNDEFGQWADSFNRMAAALAAKIDALSRARQREIRFTSDVAHELRTPLAAMVSAAEMLAESLDDLPPEAIRPAALLIDDVSRLSELVLELLELARLDAGQEEMQLERLDLDEALAAVTGTWSHDPVIQLDSEPGIVVAADRARFRRVMANLVANAITHGGGDVTIRARRHSDRAVIEVSDRGPGITAESLAHIFDRFYKEDTSRSRSGSGLGLAIALEHARAQGGSLEVANREGGGARFTFTLPIAGEPELSATIAFPRALP